MIDGTQFSEGISVVREALWFAARRQKLERGR
jgi:hypothetical protein